MQNENEILILFTNENEICPVFFPSLQKRPFFFAIISLLHVFYSNDCGDPEATHCVEEENRASGRTSPKNRQTNDSTRIRPRVYCHNSMIHDCVCRDCDSDSPSFSRIFLPITPPSTEGSGDGDGGGGSGAIGDNVVPGEDSDGFLLG